jgi:hypothetical protein
MQRLFKDAIFGEQWDEEKQKSSYSKWMVDKLIDALYNTWLVLESYKKLQDMPMNQEELDAFQAKMNSFCDIAKNWSKNSQKSVARWQKAHLWKCCCEVAT